jgi:hypothetical protein
MCVRFSATRAASGSQGKQSLRIRMASPEQETVWLEHSEGRVSIEEQHDGRRLVSVHPAPGVFVSRPMCVTAYPLALIAEILRVKSIG